MGNTNNRQIKKPNKSEEELEQLDNKMYNPWFYFSQDLIFIRDNVPLILRFLIENSIFAFSFNKSDEVDRIDGNLTELYFFESHNWISIVFQVIAGLISAPFLLFLVSMVTFGSFPAIRNLKPLTVILSFLFGLIPMGIFGIFSIPLLIIAYIQIALILLYLLLRIIQSFDIEKFDHNADIFNPETHVRVQTFFLNGICVNKYWANRNCDRITKRLQEKVGTVKPIYNPSYGIVADLLESIVLRNFRVDSTSVCLATDALERALKVTKEGDIVRLIPHSQGTIIANLAVQRLYYRLSSEKKEDLLNRLHVHTFACADRNFINPEGLLGCVEHYVNKYDPVVIFGIGRIQKKEQNIFEDVNGRGHLFNRFYSLNKDNYKPKGHNNVSDLLS